ncbi:signal peptidase I, putative [Entamoeba histolytica HM-1:IMSS-B]|uniref:Signal peptidase complex catalytic subunit SEC11 n=6 Tax=Entamoeba histolytica TaxID=5759 RepID=C4LVB9_ENTH1|nr:signal peptidase, putative [Entamoeba histolytica HM-1:IMSS]EMD43889.1 signal peptidase, putative [Entamoeba histolytica KU27]EMH77244.1 signal peptidase I, putative [Entamoeba histolytica HM-1:IMSS-B]EMS18038.1 signal peptidase [Entamoeba histolytica HM-3:IMSS]ENY60468.1 signal peptidase, putative [Entamoeba histolytica HM-1:IMSS-A]GAT92606.1 signal peptidase putative [Entamoeba histolytica]|eukprot:XP_653142.1 signal peptidase, putative [Entamoeba histolytica HM-1:IMSS]
MKLDIQLYLIEMFAPIQSLKSMGPRLIIQNVTQFGLIVASAVILWKALCIFFFTEAPIVVILSGSMEPGFKRGDLMFLTNKGGVDNIQIGDIVVYNLPSKGIPIIHRVIEIHKDTKGDVRFLTKGDNNPVDDRGLYGGPLWLKPDQIIGKSYAHIPYVGMITIALTDYPILKWTVIGLLLISVLLNKDQ